MDEADRIREVIGNWIRRLDSDECDSDGDPIRCPICGHTGIYFTGDEDYEGFVKDICDAIR